MKQTYSLVIVDDEETTRNGLTRFGNWQNLGFDLQASFEDGKETLRYLENNRIDVILTDIRMAEVSGLELASKIFKTFPETYVVIMSGYRDFDYAQKALQFGVFQYLLKPIEMDSLFSTFSSLHEKISNDRKVSHIKKIIPDIELALNKETDKNIHSTHRRLRELLEEVSSPVAEKNLNEKNEYSRVLIERTKKYVDQHYAEDISLHDISGHVHLSPIYFCRLFKELIGENFLTYLTNVRIAKSKELIKSGQYKIKEISQLVGYSNTKYFTRVFKKNVGVTPTGYIHKELQNH